VNRVEKFLVNSRLRSRSVARHAEQMLRLIEIIPGARYLDVGCGNGAAAIHLARRFGLRITGIDADPGQIAAARAAGRDLPSAQFLVADARRLPFPAGSFRIVATNKTTHHIPEWGPAFLEMARVVAPGGYLIYCDFVVPERIAAAGARLIPGLGWPTQARLQELAGGAGLACVHERRRLVNYDAVWRKIPPR
jgi:ubiquinone/menaquinone biosynthesis C-methylase UbiE